MTGSPRFTRRDLAPLAAVTAVTAGVLPVVAAGPADAATALARTGVRLRRVPGSVVRSVTVALDPGTTRLPSSSFGLVGFTWRGRRPDIRFRTRTRGAWGAWRSAEPQLDGPEPESVDGRAMRGSAAEGVWVGASDGIEVVSDRRVQLVLVDPGIVASDLSARVLPTDPAARPRRGRLTAAQRQARRERKGLGRPTMYTRADWGADESWRSSPPRYCDKLQQVHIHHTASGNDYTPGDVPALIRAFYYYHTHTLGWSDIGYNFLVDQWGRIWIGRYGGPNKLVRGAHTLGFNATSCGIAVIGNFELTTPSSSVIKALSRMAAWKLHKAGKQAEAHVTVTSEGSDLFPVGDRVLLPRIDGHRDTNQTACPGSYLYAEIPTVRARAQHRIDYYAKPRHTKHHG